MQKLNEIEKIVLNKNFNNLSSREMDIFIEIEDRIEREEICPNCNGSIVSCAFGSFMCQDCGSNFDIYDFIEN